MDRAQAPMNRTQFHRTSCSSTTGAGIHCRSTGWPPKGCSESVGTKAWRAHSCVPRRDSSRRLVGDPSLLFSEPIRTASRDQLQLGNFARARGPRGIRRLERRLPPAAWQNSYPITCPWARGVRQWSDREELRFLVRGPSAPDVLPEEAPSDFQAGKGRHAARSAGGGRFELPRLARMKQAPADRD